MAEHGELKQLISIYLDGEASPQEKQTVESHLETCGDCRKYYEGLRKLSSSMQTWKDEDLSPDLKQIINRKVQEGREMKRLTWIPGSVLVGLAVLAVLGTQVYMKRGIQGRLRSATDDVGAKYAPANVNIGPVTKVAQAPAGAQSQIGWQDVASTTQTASQYEPYYLKSNYQTKRTDATTGTQSSPVIRRELDTRMGDGYQSSKFDTSTWSKGVGFDEQTDAARNARAVPSYGAVEKEKKQDKAFGYGTKGKVMEGLEIRLNEEQRQAEFNTEQYDRVYENEFLQVTENPLSTFSIDVDTASYSNVRRFLNMNRMPPRDAVRIEEMINYFVYNYPQPKGEDPFSINTEVASCPWNSAHQLVLIGLQGKELTAEETPPSNLVFLIDVSGSMDQPNKLPLLQSAFRMMVKQLRPQEKVSIVTYAGAAGLVLDSTPGSDKQTILAAIDRMKAGGSTAGGQGIRLAYEVAKRNFIPGGNNRVILATDGDFNIGVSNDGDLVRLIEEKRKQGIFLTVLGFGTGNYKDAKMEKLADKGNGNYYYIDTFQEAKKVLGHELGSTLFTIAKDVKLQLEFNPNQVKAYRLIGYENRVLAKEDFNDDTKDAGELGSGHTVTALYEIVPAGSGEQFQSVDPLKYQKVQVQSSNDLLTVKLRYKKPDENVSRLIERVLTRNEVETTNTSENFRWASAVAEFGLLLRDSKYKGTASYGHVLDDARRAKGTDQWGYRQEFIGLVEKAAALNPASGIAE